MILFYASSDNSLFEEIIRLIFHQRKESSEKAPPGVPGGSFRGMPMHVVCRMSLSRSHPRVKAMVMSKKKYKHFLL